MLPLGAPIRPGSVTESSTSTHTISYSCEIIASVRYEQNMTKCGDAWAKPDADLWARFLNGPNIASKNLKTTQFCDCGHINNSIILHCRLRSSAPQSVLSLLPVAQSLRCFAKGRPRSCCLPQSHLRDLRSNHRSDQMIGGGSERAMQDLHGLRAPTQDHHSCGRRCRINRRERLHEFRFEPPLENHRCRLTRTHARDAGEESLGPPALARPIAAKTTPMVLEVRKRRSEEALAASSQATPA